ncbi:MAG: hypothetical protein KJN62_09380, partial [Deltaproteobacteria bacterium]|nr:hypothetical protein [Deltaproteobacteria bacterium]
TYLLGNRNIFIIENRFLTSHTAYHDSSAMIVRIVSTQIFPWVNPQHKLSNHVIEKSSLPVNVLNK